MVWRMTTFGKFITQNAVWGLEKIGLVPKGTHDVGEALKTAGTSFAIRAYLPVRATDQLFMFACS